MRQKPIFAQLKRITCLITAVILTVGLCCACDGENEKPNDSDKVKRENTAVILVSEPSLKNVYENSYASVDTSEIEKGFFNVSYTNPGDEVRMQVVKDNITYTYVLNPMAGYEAFPLSLGSGTYNIGIYKNISGSRYVNVLSTSFSVEIQNDTSPFLYPNQYVNYSQSELFVSLSEQLADNCYDEIDVVKNIYTYCVDKISYDYNKIDVVEKNYLPNIDTVITQKSGICFDYAAVMTALLRSQRIPAKLVIGYSGDVYHAWISVYITDIGWIENIIYFDGESWTLMDPTYESTYNGTKKNLENHLNDKDNYNAMFYY